MKIAPKIKINKISDILQFCDGVLTYKAIGQLLEPVRSEQTIARWVKKLRDAGYTVNTRPRGKTKLSI